MGPPICDLPAVLPFFKFENWMFGFGSIEIFVLGVFKYIWTWMFPKIVVPQNGWFIMGNLIKMDDLGVPLFSETPICIYIYIQLYIYCRYLFLLEHQSYTFWVSFEPHGPAVFRVFHGETFFFMIKQSKVYKPEYSSCSINTIYGYIHKYTFHVRTFLFNTLQCERHLFRYM